MTITASAFFDDDVQHYRARFWSHEIRFDTIRKVKDAYWRELGIETPKSALPRFDKLAQSWADREAVAIEKQLRAKPQQAKKSFAETWELYKRMNPDGVKPETIKRSEISYTHVVEFVEQSDYAGDRLLPEDIDISFVTELRNWLRDEKELAGKSILNDLTFVKQMCTFAVEWKKKTGATTLSLVSLPRVDDVTRGAFLAWTQEEYGRLREALKPQWREIFDAALTTRLRRANVLGFRTEWLDRGDKWLSVSRMVMKGGERKLRVDLSAPVPQWTVDVVPNRRDYAWPSEKRDGHVMFVDDALQEALAKAGLPRQTTAGRYAFHSLRVTGTTWLDHAGVDPLTVKVLDNRAVNEDTLNLYRKRFTPQLREAVGVLDDIRAKNGW